ncbi:hypothetical protein N7E81_07245 [Reichenbachiella carrageenanivorans]|uniref:Uncharacterized protein n=1 Tax=Reichenbachiella carrageenanivorans TaxID=2979869 RepID=A0ABY6D411_9BACT|nr:hypothetical protein [Reichenbachiella carrageenanivorans]UXX80894.1 hypothetical protein N7E81_07245 [Reichenbachiella carrageenanivorans]
MTADNRIILPPYFTKSRIQELQKLLPKHVDRVLLFYSYLMYNYLAIARREKYDYDEYRLTKFISVHSEKLAKIFGRTEYRTILSILKNEGLLEINESYHQAISTSKIHISGKTKEYKIPSRLLNHTFKKGWIKYELTDAKSINAKSNFVNFLRRSKEDNIKLCETSKNVLLESLKKLDLSFLPKGDFYDNFTGPGMDNFGKRIHSVLTNLNKKLRPLIKYSDSNETLVEIDIRTSQIYFLANLSIDWMFKVLRPQDAVKFESTIQKLEKCEGFKLFRKDVLFSDVDIYCRFGEEFEIERSDAKNLIFSILFSSPYGDKGSEFDCFEEAYPGLLDILNQIKTEKINSSTSNKRHSNLTLILQRMESNLVLDQVVEEAANYDITDLLTIHDSWLVKASEADKFIAIAEGVFERVFGNSPNLTITQLEDTKKEPSKIEGSKVG